MCRGAVVGVERVKEGAQHAALGRADAEVGAGGDVATVRQEVLDP